MSGGMLSDPEWGEVKHLFYLKEHTQRDLNKYIEGYPGKTRESEDSTCDKNVMFYSDKIAFEPDGVKLSEVHETWRGNFLLMESSHTYIQWLFPIREKGMNDHSQPLMLHEIDLFRAGSAPAAQSDGGPPPPPERYNEFQEAVLRSYALILEFFGFQLGDARSGAVEPHPEFATTQMELVNRSSHNQLRMTRILKCLGEVGLGHLQIPLLLALGREAFGTGRLCQMRNGLCTYYLHTVRDHSAREMVRLQLAAMALEALREEAAQFQVPGAGLSPKEVCAMSLGGLIRPWLVVGNKWAGLSPEFVAIHGITHIVNISRHVEGTPNCFDSAEGEELLRRAQVQVEASSAMAKERLLEGKGPAMALPLPGPEGRGRVKYLRVELENASDAGITKHVRPFSAFLDSARGSSPAARVLVACSDGCSRSAALVMAYFMNGGGQVGGGGQRPPNASEALGELRGLLPHARPNMGFMQQLLELEAKTHPGKESSIKMHEYMDMSREEYENMGRVTQGPPPDNVLACPVCTFHNKLDALACSMCTTPLA